MSCCYICGKPLNTQNKSREHIIPNCIGGSLVSDDLLCKNCNSITGDNLEAEVGKQLNFAANMLGITRDRGSFQPMQGVNSDTGEPMKYSFGKPEVIRPKIEHQKETYHVEARDKKQAREVLSALKRKHPEIDVDKEVENAKYGKEYLNSFLMFNENFGGSTMFKAITKIAIIFYLYSGGYTEHIEELLQYFKDNLEFTPQLIANFYYPNPPIFSNNDDEVTHSIIIKGDKQNKLLYGYIDLFSFFQTIVIMNYEYAGENIERSYFYDVVARKSVKKEYEFSVSHNNIDSLLGAEQHLYLSNFSALKNRMSRLIEIACRRQRDSIRNQIISEAMELTMGHEKYSNEKFITEEMINEFINKLMEILLLSILGIILKIWSDYNLPQ